MSWAEKIKEIEQKLAANNRRIAELNILLEPFEEKIAKLKQEGKPYWSERNKLADEVRKMQWNLQIAEKQAFIESLQVGSELWIKHDKLYKGRYQTIKPEQRKEIVRKNPDAVFHRIEITEVIPRKTERGGFVRFRAKEKNISYLGLVQDYGSGVPVLHWRKGGVIDACC